MIMNTIISLLLVVIVSCSSNTKIEPPIKTPLKTKKLTKSQGITKIKNDTKPVGGFEIFKLENNLIYIDTNERNEDGILGSRISHPEKVIVFTVSGHFEAKFVDHFEESILLCEEVNIPRNFWRFTTQTQDQYELLFVITEANVEQLKFDRKKLVDSVPDQKIIDDYKNEILKKSNDDIELAKVDLKRVDNCKMKSNSEFKEINCAGTSFFLIDNKVIVTTNDNGYEGNYLEVDRVVKVNGQKYYLLKIYGGYSLISPSGERISIRSSKVRMKC